MANNNYFSHYTLGGLSPTDRAIAAGYPGCKVGTTVYSNYGIGENIFMEWGNLGTHSDIAHSAFNAWMNSSGHRANILDSYYVSEGIGCAIVGDRVYITEDFCMPF